MLQEKMEPSTLPSNIVDLLACPNCGGEIEVTQEKDFLCIDCGTNFGFIEDNIIDMRPTETLPVPAMYLDPVYIETQKRSEEVFKYIYDSKSLVSFFNNYYHVIQHRYLRKFSSPRQWILELGCGSGAHFKHIPKSMHHSYIGIDSNIDLLRGCRKKFPEVTLVLGDLYKLPFKSGSVYNALSLCVLEHLYYIEEALEEVFRVLSDEGKLFVTLPTDDGFLWQIGRRLTSQRVFEKAGINYKKYIEVQHCNTIYKTSNAVKKKFQPIKINYYPFLLPSFHLNIFVNGIFRKPKNR